MPQKPEDVNSLAIDCIADKDKYTQITITNEQAKIIGREIADTLGYVLSNKIDSLIRNGGTHGTESYRFVETFAKNIKIKI